MERKQLTVHDLSILDITERNFGAEAVVKKLLSTSEEGVFDILDMLDMNLRGTQIWLAYMDYCGGDIELLKKLVRARDADLVEGVNIANAKQGEPFKAVQRGASAYQYPLQYEFAPGEQEEYAAKPFEPYRQQNSEFEA